jgi:hypothetical protein
MKGPNENKFATVQIEYDIEKLEAVRFFLMDKNATVERELLDAMDAIFKKHVPAQVRDYIERKNAPPPPPVATDQQGDK